MSNEYAQAIEDARADLAGEAADFFPDTCKVLRRTLADDGRSGKEETYPEHTTLPCRVSREYVGAEDKVDAAKQRSQDRLVVQFVAGADVRETDRLEIYGGPYSIIGPVDSLASELWLKVLVMKL